MTHATNCTRYGAGGCAGDGGETCRRCPSKALSETATSIKQAAIAEWRHQMHTAFIGVLWTVLALAVIGTSAGFGLGKTETSYQMDARR
ncbi:hypothetical protein [Rhizobium alvei]|uniref:Uncharacterized protein n=1 Tax=Rhizobium alvei TaxID=1132659 RepID=A0ABT8YT32_9HYPH|nr:hypothetical protein [Rhizobium alvei]MDO6966931.1 hypothetical protein [Rhizobium alvei]